LENQFKSIYTRCIKHHISNGCKVIFTTRSLEVCGRMEAGVKMVVQCLPPHDALELFKKKVGEITLGNESKGMERAENKAYEIMGSLICSSLLIQHEERSNFVYLHDVVREMALWIASDFGKQKDNFIVHACVGLEEIPKVQNWNIVKRILNCP
ncbi:BnaC06g41410D, partial [Brassica napus]